MQKVLKIDKIMEYTMVNQNNEKIYIENRLYSNFLWIKKMIVLYVKLERLK